jgi:hypothetical protein
MPDSQKSATHVKPARGRCRKCGRRYPLRKDGTLQTHDTWRKEALGMVICQGSGRKP